MSEHNDDANLSVYSDTGCDIHDACLTCPLRVCRYDLDQPLRATQVREAIRVSGLLRSGLLISEVAAAVGRAERTVVKLWKLADSILAEPAYAGH